MKTHAGCANILRHIQRIKGQLSTLERYVEDGRDCDDVAHLLKSVTASFGSVRSAIAEEMLMRELAAGRLHPRDRERARSIVSVLGK